MLRYRVSLHFDQIIIAEATADDLRFCIAFVLGEAAKSADLIASRVPMEVGEYRGEFRVQVMYL